MKHVTLTAAALSVAFGAIAQNTPAGAPALDLRDVPQIPVEMRVPQQRTHFAVSDLSERPAQPLNAASVGEHTHYTSREIVIERAIIGVTQYDLQSNAAIDDRVAGSGNSVSTAWTMSLELTPFADRGTGHNFWDGTAWGDQPYERIETIRVGWPSICRLGNGNDAVVAHQATGPLVFTTRTAGSGAWTESNVPTELEAFPLWPRMAAGGADGNTLHVLAVSTPVANGGVAINGQDGALLYFRSQDGGATWDIIDHQFPELGPDSFVGFSGDIYAIHASGNTVAFAVFNDFSDSFVMVSEDNGDTWTYNSLVDFPVDLYVVDAGLPEIGEDWDEDGIFAEFYNTDGAGDVHIDGNGQVHVVYGAMYYADTDLTDGNFSYFPGVNGLQYWTPSFGPDSSQTIAYAYDIDASGTLDLEDEIAAYFVNLAGLPSIATGAFGQIYVSYSAIMENFSTGVQNYRHLYMVKSDDNGTTWTSDAACDLTPDSDFDGYEAMFGSLSPDASNGTIELIYQRDYEPGLHVRGDEDPVDLNDIVHLRFSVDGLNDCADVSYEDWVGVPEPMQATQLLVYPNPAQDVVSVVIDRPGQHEVIVRNATGAVVQRFTNRARVETLDVSGWAAGVYTVEFIQGAERAVLRLAVQ